MRIADLVALLQSVAPLHYAESWDKVGLLVGDRERVISPLDGGGGAGGGGVLLTIDLSEAVLREAINSQCSMIVAYHPPIFEPLSKITDATPRQRVILHALEAKLAIYSPHTALDAIPGGVTDWLCEGLSGSTTPGKIAGDCRALTPHAATSPTQQLKIVTFVPEKHVDHVRGALASAGAGRIGLYEVCSFSTPGEGTFLGASGSAPAIGHAGALERVREVRLEMVCGRAGLAIALETLRKLHPYEEPAIDVYELVAQPRRTLGAGRRLVLDKPVTVRELAARLKAWVQRDHLRFAIPGDVDVPVSRIGVVPGAGASLSKLAREEGCEVFVTGEMRHHDVLGSLNAGMGVILGGHTSTERGYLPRLQAELVRREPGLTVRVSTMDKTPLVSM
jgi:dinuclear metal center YbgI/SA1388 family protein